MKSLDFRGSRLESSLHSAACQCVSWRNDLSSLGLWVFTGKVGNRSMKCSATPLWPQLVCSAEELRPCPVHHHDNFPCVFSFFQEPEGEEAPRATAYPPQFLLAGSPPGQTAALPALCDCGPEPDAIQLYPTAASSLLSHPSSLLPVMAH